MAPVANSPELAVWRAPLLGHTFDLEDLPVWLAGCDVHVEAIGEVYFLIIPVEVAGDSPEVVQAFVAAHLEIINGIGRVLDRSYRPVAPGPALYGVNAAGDVINTVIAISGVESRGKAGSLRAIPVGISPPDQCSGAAAPLIRAASSSGRAHDALVILGRPHLTWSELYVLYELVNADAKRRKFKLGWIGKADDHSFRKTVNSYTALRTQGRHGKDSGTPPIVPMTRDAASRLISELVRAWLRHAGTNSR